MKLNPEERFALIMVFEDNSPLSSEIRTLLDAADVIERKYTGVGFFSIIRFSKPLIELVGNSQWEWNFRHKKLSHGGSFICWFEEKDKIILEAVSHIGKWPSFNKDDFTEA